MKKILNGLGLLLISMPLLALETGWLELEAGHVDSQSGSAVRSVNQQNDEQIITIAIPKKQLAHNTQNIEEIVVIGRRLKGGKEEAFKDVSYQWAKDFEGDNYGLIITLKQHSNLPIRLHFARDEGSLTP